MVGVTAFLALDGAPLGDSTGAAGAPAGRFVLHNAFGPRVLRCVYSLAPDSPWWPSRVLLDGADVTDVPIDFRTHEHSQLDVVFTQHPARFAGTVRDGRGRPVVGAWILVFAANRSLWQSWATTSRAVQADAQGTFPFRVASRPLPGPSASTNRAV